MSHGHWGRRLPAGKWKIIHILRRVVISNDGSS